MATNYPSGPNTVPTPNPPVLNWETKSLSGRTSGDQGPLTHSGRKPAKKSLLDSTGQGEEKKNYSEVLYMAWAQECVEWFKRDAEKAGWHTASKMSSGLLRAIVCVRF